MGNFCWDDLVNQPSPRLFSTHVTSKFLPEDLKTRAKMIYVTRNPKDCLNSLHYFRGEAKDGWTGNEHGPGSLRRFLDGVNAYGDFFHHICDADDYMRNHLGDRAMVLHYERMKEDIEARLVETAAFLGVPLNETKKGIILQEIDIETMRAKKDNVASILIRKGVTRDWENAPLTAEHWAEFDQKYKETVGNRKIAEPFIPYL